MFAARHTRPQVGGSALTRLVLSAVRILIGSYFLATATSMWLSTGDTSFLDFVVSEQTSETYTPIYLAVASVLLMLGVAIRSGALLLAVYSIWSAMTHHSLGDPVAMAIFWRDMALVATILLLAVTDPGLNLHLRGRPVRPRRVRAPVRRKRAPSDRDLSPVTQQALATLKADFAEAEDPVDDDDDDDGENVGLFDDVWDTPGRQHA